MAAALKHRITFDTATRELWRVAESGNINELEKILARGVDVDARNEHGMTALMRAANNGCEQMVRALLKHGADPNITRNDRFTALALAAFFGHTETVRVLIEHGAKTEVVTRFGTSPLMWATARTFKDAAHCIEEKKKRPAPVPAPAPIPMILKKPVAVKTLSEPPEIWDLVHEVPRGFDARSAFFSRLRSMKKTYAAGVFAGLLLIVGCGVAALVLRSSEARNLSPQPAPVQAAVETTVTSQPVVMETSTPAAPLATESEPVSAHVVKKTPVTRQPRNRSWVPAAEIEVSPVTETPAPAVATPQFEKPKPAVVTSPKSEPNTALSPHLITPAKSAAPKSKVIQWP